MRRGSAPLDPLFTSLPKKGSLNRRCQGKSLLNRNFCRFKWSFNIKPDMVVLLAGSQPLCIEAKLESREGWYPSNAQECAIFDMLFCKRKGRVGQIELQRFMFEHLLGSPCQAILIGRTAPVGSGDDAPVLFLRWKEVFRELDEDSSIPYVRKLIEENHHL